MLPTAAIPSEVLISGGAGLFVSFIAFSALILAPAIGSFSRTWEKATAVLLSLFVLVALVLVGVAVGALIVLHWDEISSVFS